MKESCANANTNRYRAPLPRRSRSSFSNIEGRDFFPDGERGRHADPARGEKKTALPPGISRKRKARIDARPSQTTPTQPQIPQNCIDARKPRKLRSRAIGIFPRFTRAHIFFLDQKRPNKCRREGGKKFHPPETARARPNAKSTIARKPRDISLRCEPNGEKERGETREHPQFTTHHFCLSKIFLLFSFFSV